jgi:hypothetical protein
MNRWLSRLLYFAAVLATLCSLGTSTAFADPLQNAVLQSTTHEPGGFVTYTWYNPNNVAVVINFTLSNCVNVHAPCDQTNSIEAGPNHIGQMNNVGGAQDPTKEATWHVSWGVAPDPNF